MLKRILPVLFAMCLMLSVGTLTAFADGNEAKIGDLEYATLEEALDAAAAKSTITLINDVTVDDIVSIDKQITINGQGKYTITGTASKTFEVNTASKVAFKNVTIINTHDAGKCVDTRIDKGELWLTDVKLETTGNGNNQPLTIGGNDAYAKNKVVYLKRTTINAGAAGYGIIAFVPVDITLSIDTEIEGYSAIYLKDGSDGSDILAGTNVVLKGVNNADGVSSDFGTVVFESAGNIFTAQSGAQIIAEGNGEAYQSLFSFNSVSDEANTINLEDVSLETVGNTVLACGTNLDTAVINANTEDAASVFTTAGYIVDDSQKVAISSIAEVDEVKYAVLDEAIKVARSQYTVKLLQNVTADEAFTVPAGVTLDLNGKTFTADVTANGNIIDSTDGTGSVVGDIVVNNHANGNYIPLPDGDSYRLFKVSVTNKGMKKSGEKVIFGFAIIFNNEEAYDLLSIDPNADILLVEFVVSGTVDETTEFKFAVSSVQNFAGQAYDQLTTTDKTETSKALLASVTVDDTYAVGDTISATPSIKTVNGVVIGGFGTITYTK